MRRWLGFVQSFLSASGVGRMQDGCAAGHAQTTRDNKPALLRALAEIRADTLALERQSEGLLLMIVGAFDAAFFSVRAVQKIRFAVGWRDSCALGSSASKVSY